MKLVKYLFLLVLMLSLAVLAYVSILESEFEIEKEIKLKAPRDLVFQEINQLKKWKEWSSVLKNAHSISFSEKTQGDRASFAWKNDSLKVYGEMENIKVEHDSHILQRATVEKTIGKTNYDLDWKFRKQNDSVSIHLNLKGKLNFHAKLLRLLKKEKLQERISTELNTDFQQIKHNVLQTMQVFSVNVDGVKDMPPSTFVYTSISTKNRPEILSKQREDAFGKLQDFLKSQEIPLREDPFMIFNSIDRSHDNVIVSFGIPIQIMKDIDIEDSNKNILTGSSESQKVIKSTLKGDYQNIAKLWEATRVYMQENHLRQDREAHAYEVFKITSADSENPADWITELYVPIQETETRLNLEREIEL